MHRRALMQGRGVSVKRLAYPWTMVCDSSLRLRAGWLVLPSPRGGRNMLENPQNGAQLLNHEVSAM